MRAAWASDTLDGGIGADTLEGGVGADTLDGGTIGADTMSLRVARAQTRLRGGAGDDKVLYDDAGEGVKVDLSTLQGRKRTLTERTVLPPIREARLSATRSNTDIEDVVGLVDPHDDWLTGDG